MSDAEIAILAIDAGAKCSGWCVGLPGGQPISDHTHPISKAVRSWSAIRQEAVTVIDGTMTRHHHRLRVVIESPWSRANQATALLVARVVHTWVLTALDRGLAVEEVPPIAWQSLVGSRRQMGEVAWRQALLDYTGGLGGRWGPLMPKTHKSVFCVDELCARGIWAWAVAKQQEADHA